MKYMILTLLLVAVCSAKDRHAVPQAPLPTVVANAKKVFLTNGGGSSLAFDAFYLDMKDWGRYEVVGSPESADLVMELSYVVESGGTRVWSAVDSYTGQMKAHSAQITDPQLVLHIYEVKSKTVLWSVVERPKEGRFEFSPDKAMVRAADKIVQQLKDRMP
jgi:hypothetical protein